NGVFPQPYTASASWGMLVASAPTISDLDVMTRFGLACTIAALFFGDAVRADDDKEATGALALMQSRCVKCHGGDKPKAGLELTTLEKLGRGSKSGAVVVPGKPESSRLWQLVQEGEMPPKAPLSEAERAVLKRWIESGAPGLKLATRTHWAFVPPVRPTPPSVKRTDRVRTDVDRF